MKKTFVVLFMMVLAVSAFGQEQQGENFAFLSVVKGHVFLQEEQAKQDQYILQNDWLITESGTVDVRFGEEGGYLEVGENSKVFFVEVNSKKSVIAFFQGTVRLRNLENVELRAAGKPEGKIIVPEKDQVIRVDIVGDNISVENIEPVVIESEVEPEVKPEDEPEIEVKSEKEQRHTVYVPCFIWAYPSWYSWYPLYYNYWYYYGYYNYPYQYNYSSNNYSYSEGGLTSQVVRKSQLQRQVTVRPSRLNSNSVRSTNKTISRRIVNFPSKVSRTTSINSRSTISRSSSKSSFSLMGRLTTRSAVKSTSKSAIRSVSKSASNFVGRSMNGSVGRSANKSTSRSISKSTTSGSLRRK